MKDIFIIHEEEYDTAPDCTSAAPTIVKILGEHTDFTDGLVLSASLSFEVRVAISFRKDNSLRFYAADFNERKRANVATFKYKREDRWANHVKSVCDYFWRVFNLDPRGLNVTIQSNVPLGLGLGISSAINMATALIFKTLYDLDLKLEELAFHAWKAQSLFFEKELPITNYLAITAPAGRSFSIIDLHGKKRRGVQFLPEPWEMLLTDSKVPRSSVDAELEQRIADCKACISVLVPYHNRSIRDIAPQELDELLGIVPERKRRRCLHVLEEVRRVVEAEESLSRQDYVGFGRIVNKSHASLRSLYEISCPEIDWLTKRALELDDVLCSRLVGQGFGGSTLTILKNEKKQVYRNKLEDYERIFGFKPIIHEVSTGAGLRILEH
ncbi:MAG TPA: galactokinase family protein [Rectinema sp.]|jgi:galactokinase|nr:galactokinase [Spirochaetia bacterium]HNV18745.1 galactokinase family protein [Rectinema sp.]HOD57623.1 galactokinase family protein [Rectinema sp.]HOH04563.1 galactokinase family protein [Rectinema sp.]HPB06718.1 galactokinase family protein [Rectinema sp.]